MPEETLIPDSSLSSSKTSAAKAEASEQEGNGLRGGQPGDAGKAAPEQESLDGLDGLFDVMAPGLYSLASMLAGEGEESIRLVEIAVATAEVPSRSSAEEAHRSSRRALAKAAVELIAGHDPNVLAAPEGLEHAVTCIEDDDLDAAAAARETMERMAGPDRERVRQWLESLSTSMRTIYVLRAVAGLTATETAALLASRGGPRAAGWNADAVRELFRQALCSLASQLIHATSGR